LAKQRERKEDWQGRGLERKFGKAKESEIKIGKAEGRERKIGKAEDKRKEDWQDRG
jgi:hypothetical protein